MNLAEAVAVVCTVCSEKSAAAMGAFIHMKRAGGTLELSAHDGIKSIRAKAQSDGPAFSAVVDGKRLKNAVSAIGALSVVDFKKDKITIKRAGAAKNAPSFTMAAGADVGLPEFVAVPDDAVVMSCTDLRRSIERTRPAMHDSEHMPHMFGVQIEASGRAAATDGHVFAYTPAPKGLSVFVPGGMLASILAFRCESVRVAKTSSYLIVAGDEILLQTSLSTAQFREYGFLLALKSHRSVRVRKDAFLDALKVATLSVSADSVFVDLSIDGDELRIGGASASDEAEGFCACEGNMHAVRTTPRQLKIASDIVDGDDVIIGTSQDMRSPAGRAGEPDRVLPQPILITGSEPSTETLVVLTPGAPK